MNECPIPHSVPISFWDLIHSLAPYLLFLPIPSPHFTSRNIWESEMRRCDSTLPANFNILFFTNLGIQRTRKVRGMRIGEECLMFCLKTDIWRPCKCWTWNLKVSSMAVRHKQKPRNRAPLRHDLSEIGKDEHLQSRNLEFGKTDHNAQQKKVKLSEPEWTKNWNCGKVKRGKPENEKTGNPGMPEAGNPANRETWKTEKGTHLKNTKLAKPERTETRNCRNVKTWKCKNWKSGNSDIWKYYGPQNLENEIYNSGKGKTPEV